MFGKEIAEMIGKKLGEKGPEIAAQLRRAKLEITAGILLGRYELTNDEQLQHHHVRKAVELALEVEQLVQQKTQ
jgi:hypothetical protein